MPETLRLSWFVVYRNWVVYRKNFWSNISPTVVDPMFFVFALGVGLGAYVTGIQGQTYAEFIVPGLLGSTALFTSFFETSYGFYVRMVYESIFRAMLTTPIGYREIILGEYIWTALKGALMTLGVGIILGALGFVHRWEALLVVPFIGALVAVASGAIGLIATSRVKNIDQFQLVYSLFISPLFFFSGIFFPIASMPQPLQWVAWSLPLAHGVAMFQSLMWGTPLRWWLHIGVLLIQTAILIAIASPLVRRRLMR